MQYGKEWRAVSTRWYDVLVLKGMIPACQAHPHPHFPRISSSFYNRFPPLIPSALHNPFSGDIVPSLQTLIWTHYDGPDGTDGLFRPADSSSILRSEFKRLVSPLREKKINCFLSSNMNVDRIRRNPKKLPVWNGIDSKNKMIEWLRIVPHENKVRKGYPQSRVCEHSVSGGRGKI